MFSICHHSRAGARDVSEAFRAIGMFFINMIFFILLIHFYYSILELSTTTTTSSHSHLNGLHLTSTHPTSTTNGHLNTSSHSNTLEYPCLVPVVPRNFEEQIIDSLPKYLVETAEIEDVVKSVLDKHGKEGIYAVVIDFGSGETK